MGVRDREGATGLSGSDTCYLAVEALGLGSVVSLNGVPLVVDEEGKGIASELPVNLWLMPGENLVSVHLFEADLPPASADEEDEEIDPPTPRAEVRMYLADPESENPAPGRILLDFRWPGEDQGELPFGMEQGVPPVPLPTTRLWNEGEQVDGLTGADRVAILGLVEDLRSCLMEGDGPGAFDLLAYRFAEEAQAEGKPVSRLRTVVLEQFEWMRSHQPLESEPLTLAEAQFRIAGNGRVVCVSRGEYGFPVHLYQPRGAMLFFGVPVYVGRIGGRWMIVR